MVKIQFDDILLYYGIYYTLAILIFALIMVHLYQVYVNSKFIDSVVKELRRLKFEKANVDSFDDEPTFMFNEKIDNIKRQNFYE